MPLPGYDCPYAASDRASTAVIDSAMSHPTRDLLTMSLTYLMFAAFLISHYFQTPLGCFELYHAAATGSLRIVHRPHEKTTAATIIVRATRIPDSPIHSSARAP